MVQLETLLPLLASSDPAVRDKAALALHDLGDSAAVAPLLKAISEPANANHRGTLVYALQALDCTKHFLPLFDLALSGSYEVQCHALTILGEQAMQVTTSELKDAEAQLHAYLPPAHTSSEDADQLKAELGVILAKLK